jgi:hypothetical protein
MEMTAFDTAISLSILVSLLVAFLLPIYLLSGSVKEAQEKVRARRLKEAQMNARLLRLNI